MPNEAIRPRRSCSGNYVLCFCAALVLALSLVALTNFVLDPFALHRWIEIEGGNASKPAVHTRVRLFKAYELERVRPRTVVLGSSRSHVGFSCSHPAFADPAGPCYNLAFDGATTREMYAYLVHANEVRRLKSVVLGLDTYHLSKATSATRPGFDSAILLSPAHPAWRRAVEGDLRLAISAETLRASLDMVRHQAEREPEWFSDDGQRLGEVFFRREGEEFVRSGPRAYFDDVDRLEVGFQLPPREQPVERTDAPPPDPEESSLAYIGRIVAFCLSHGIDLRIAITPSHVHQLEISAMLGAGTAAEAGKRALVQMLDEQMAWHGRDASKPIPVWDFSGYSSITTEPLPPIGSYDEMQFYWDSSHFKSIVGDLVLDRVFAIESPSRLMPADFGVQLTAANIEEVLSMQRAKQAEHRRRAREDLATLRRLVDESAAALGARPE